MSARPASRSVVRKLPPCPIPWEPLHERDKPAFEGKHGAVECLVEAEARWFFFAVYHSAAPLRFPRYAPLAQPLLPLDALELLMENPR